MKRILRNNRAVNNFKYYTSLKFLFPEYINPNEKLSYEIRNKISKDNEEINGKTLDQITKPKNKHSDFYLYSLRKNIENFSDFKNEILTRSLGINDEFHKKVPSYSTLVYKFLYEIFKII